jgi:type II secretion system protein G
LKLGTLTIKWGVRLVKFHWFAAAILVLQACSDQSKMMDEAIELGLVDERHADFWKLNRYRRGVICGKWDASAEEAIYREGFKYFIIRDGVANTSPNKGYWQVFCAEDPSIGLKKRFGIGPFDTDAEKEIVGKIYTDLTSIVTALKAYQRDFKDYPYTHQGLGTLQKTKASSGQAGTYLKTLPMDPWGRPYRYEYSELSGGVAVRYKLYTLGADDKPGGEGENADINADHLEFLDYVLFP